MKRLSPVVTLFVLSLLAISCDSTDSFSVPEEALENFLNKAEPIAKEDLEKAPMELQEFAMNYQLLDLFYINAHTEQELGMPKDYYGKYDENVSTETSFKDVVYMYSQMSCIYTRYYDPKSNNYLTNHFKNSGEVSGFGIDYDTLNHSTTENAIVASVFPNGPAYTAGIKEGDTILTIDNKNATIEAILATEAFLQESSESAFTLKRGKDTLSISVAKQSFINPTVFIHQFKDIPVITITKFSDTTYLPTGTYGEFKEALKRTEGAKATIIDLANNGGGSQDQCLSMAAELLPQNTVLIRNYEADVDSSNGVYRQKIDTITYTSSNFNITRDGLAKDRYIVFVQNSETASCSEVMIAAVTASKNAPVVGEQSYGKGIGQYYIETVAKGYAGITGVKIFDKNMDSYHGYGIQPDILTKNHQESMEKAYEIAGEGTFVRTEGYSKTPSRSFTKTSAKSMVGNNYVETDIREFLGAYKLKRLPYHNFNMGLN